MDPSATRKGNVRTAVAGLGRGLAAGLLGTLAMSSVMLIAKASGQLGTSPPTKITRRVAGALGLRRRGPQVMLAAVANHFAFGAGVGAAYALAESALGRRGRSAVATGATGAAFGLSLWAVNYAGWIPAAGIMPFPTHDRPHRPAWMAGAHVVYGMVTAMAASALRERSRVPTSLTASTGLDTPSP